MLRQIVTSLSRVQTKRLISTSSICLNRVTIIGGAGGIGQTLAMLMKADHLVTDLVLMDLKKEIHGIAADVSHIDTFSGVKSFAGVDKMAEALSCTNLVVVAAGVPRSPTMNTRDKLFDANAEIIYQVAMHKAKQCPEAFLAIITNPVNALIPLAAEILKQNDAYDPKKLFGITKVDAMRTRTFIADFLVIDPTKLKVNIIGGHSDTTIVPVISQTSPSVKGDPDDIEKIYGQITTGGTAVMKAKENKGTAQLSIAHVAMTFCHSLLQAMDGKSGVTDVAYVESSVFPDTKFFSSSFDLGKEGIKKFHPMPELNEFEQALLDSAVPELKANIEKGIKFAQSKKGSGKKEEKTKCEN